MGIIETDRQRRVWSVQFTYLESQARALFEGYVAGGLGIRAPALRALQEMPRTKRTAGFVTHLSEGLLALGPETSLVVVA